MGVVGTMSGNISIHAPRAGRDQGLQATGQAWVEFQSTRPVRGATVFQ